MPEGPECRRVTQKLRELLKGKVMLWLELYHQAGTDKYRNAIEPLWQQVEFLFPSTCLDVICRGKQIFFFMENNLCLFGGLGMEGHWYRFDTTCTDPGVDTVEDYLAGKSKAGIPHPKFCLHFGRTGMIRETSLEVSQIQIWYDDSRAFGNFTIGTWDQAFTKMTEIGPDWLATRHPWTDLHPVVQSALPPFFWEGVTVERLMREIRAPRRGHMNICKFLMENKYLSGVGNYLKSEILYRSKIHPSRTLSSLTQEEIDRLFGVTLNTISYAYQCGGLTHGTFLDPDMEKGQFPIYVYKRQGQTDREGHLIEYSKEFDNRGTFYVSAIQR